MVHKDPEYQSKYRAQNKERLKKYYAEYRERNKEHLKEQNLKYRDKNKEQIAEYQNKYRSENKEKLQEYQYIYNTNYACDIKQHTLECMRTGNIIEPYKWSIFCKEFKRKNNKKPFSSDFTDGVMFEMMIKGCFYCRNIATSIDRIDSTLDHTIDNCVGCCKGCNISKGAADPATFVRKAYYRVHEKYYDDDIDIWFVNKNKPGMANYQRRAKKKEISFELTTEDFDVLINGECAYCKRSPTTWFGIDRVITSLGYVLGNVVSCCWDCNNDKSDDDVDTIMSGSHTVWMLESSPLVIMIKHSFTTKNYSNKTRDGKRTV